MGGGTGDFSAPTNFRLTSRPRALAVGDFNGDEIPDLAAINSNSEFVNLVSILLGVPSGLTGFQSPPGDFSTLVKNGDGTFTRTLKGGTTINFDADGLQTSIVDRNGNRTIFEYDVNDRLETMTDPAGLLTTLTYFEGSLSTITDPALRVTEFFHDPEGNLIRIVDPDQTERVFTYDSSSLLMSQTSKRGVGFVTTYDYDFAGRNIGVTRPDGSTRKNWAR